jgi:hypothetical protein
MKELDLEDLDELEELDLITDKDIIMKGGAAAAGAPPPPALPPPLGAGLTQPTDDFNVPNALQQDLLQILDEGINDIVIQIKKKIGNGKVETNQYAKRIVDLLDNLSTELAPKIKSLDADIDTEDPNAPLDRVVVYKDDTTNKYTTIKQKNYEDLNLVTGQPGYENLSGASDNNQKYNADTLLEFYKEGKYTNKGYGISAIGLNSHINMTTLDSPQTGNNPTNVIEKETTNVAEIETRLNNCQYLELLYLVKHDELMKTFAFTLNLFDKYKYSIKVLLFVLKNLVYKTGSAGPPGPGGTTVPNIKLPKALIPNILKLIQDQNKVQEVITSMQDTLDENSGKYKAGDQPEIIATVAKLNSLSRDESPTVPPSEAKLKESTNLPLSPPALSGISPS